MSNKQTSPSENTGLSLAELRAKDSNEELTPDQAAAEAGKTRQTIYLWLRRKGADKLKARKDGLRGWKIRRADLVSFLESSQHRADDDGQPRDDSATRGILLLLLDVAQAGVRWREANAISEATREALQRHEWPPPADVELAERCYAEATGKHGELLDAIRKLSAGQLEEMRAAIERGDFRMILPPGTDNELVFSPARDDADALASTANH